jgi:hypothetical protein
MLDLPHMGYRRAGASTPEVLAGAVAAKLDRTAKTFVLNAAREQVLLEIVFRGRSRKARFLTANRKSP